ncbi:MAG TPA: hypothetical protein VNZ52_16820 [Candidatus Thermoplasmatota archaeon]|nr:hypothetical protein [Candidatus Thermoplasmatota archaeon]
MTRAFIQVAIPVLYVYDPEHFPEKPPGFDMSLLPVISRVLKEHAGTPNVTVITGAPTLIPGLQTAFTQLALQYPTLQKASPDAGNLILAELATENFDPESVLEHLRRFIEARDEGAREVAARFGRGTPIEGAEEQLAEEGFGEGEGEYEVEVEVDEEALEDADEEEDDGDGSDRTGVPR